MTILKRLNVDWGNMTFPKGAVLDNDASSDKGHRAEKVDEKSRLKRELDRVKEKRGIQY